MMNINAVQSLRVGSLQARMRLIENSDAVRRLSVEEVAALAEAIEAIDTGLSRSCART